MKDVPSDLNEHLVRTVGIMAQFQQSARNNRSKQVATSDAFNSKILA
jgi:hypothetical protein